MKLSYVRRQTEFSLPVMAGITDEQLNAIWTALSKAYGIPVDSVRYLWRYGFGQSFQDSYANPVKVAKDKLKAERDTAGLEPPTEAELDAVAAPVEIEALHDRMASIKDGSIATKGGQRDPFGTACRKFAEAKVRAHYKKTGEALPKGDDFTAVVEATLEDNRATIEREVKRAQAAADKIEVKVAVKA
jgi:hypothetical protein